MFSEKTKSKILKDKTYYEIYTDANACVNGLALCQEIIDKERMALKIKQLEIQVALLEAKLISKELDECPAFRVYA